MKKNAEKEFWRAIEGPPQFYRLNNDKLIYVKKITQGWENNH